jgi:Ni,Fe-hydrogenase maturation factor
MINKDSLFGKFMAVKREKIPDGTISKVQAHKIAMNQDFMATIRALQKLMHAFAVNQYNEELSKQTHQALDTHVEVLKKYLADVGETL